ncbi:hypothetical protein CYMTET_33822, partial [Cymbomonas tetramitiformis]
MVLGLKKSSEQLLPDVLAELGLILLIALHKDSLKRRGVLVYSRQGTLSCPPQDSEATAAALPEEIATPSPSRLRASVSSTIRYMIHNTPEGRLMRWLGRGGAEGADEVAGQGLDEVAGAGGARGAPMRWPGVVGCAGFMQRGAHRLPSHETNMLTGKGNNNEDASEPSTLGPWLGQWWSLGAVLLQVPLQRKYRGMRRHDLYSSMLLWSGLAAFVAPFCYSPHADPTNDDPLETDNTQYNIPKRVLSAILVEFTLLVLDRSAYVLARLQFKAAIQVVSNIMFHVQLMQRPPMQLGTPLVRLLYLLKSMYWLLSARQIREGYPMYMQGEFLKRHRGSSSLVLQ